MIKLVDLLEREGMLEVTDRRTARIPIVMFTDPDTNIRCDVCIDNQLATRNTLLLRVYALADERFRKLGYTIKNWSKKRGINSPSDGTLSSYAYLLLALHSLQRVSPPVMPYLQQLPPDWDGVRGDGRRGPAAGGGADDVGAAEPPVLPRQPTRAPANPIMAQRIAGAAGGAGAEKGKRVFYECDTYFYTGPPGGDGLPLLQQFAKRNDMSPGRLLLHFFWLYSTSFDCQSQVVRVRESTPVAKSAKVEEDGYVAAL